MYRVNADKTEDEIQSITLDGVVDVYGEDETWAAAFRDLSRVDDDGNEVSYYVKETAVDYGDATEYYTTFDDTTRTNGGAISNVVAYGKLNITKTLELPVDADPDEYLQNLVIAVSGPSEIQSTDSHYVNAAYKARDFERSTATTSSGKLVTLTKTVEVPAGTYSVIESGYDVSGLSSHWASGNSWTKADKTTDASISNVEVAGATSAEVEVGMDTSDQTNVAINNNYEKLHVGATKVWDDGGVEGMSHPVASLTLSRKVGDTTEAITGGTHTIAAGATGDALTTTWEDLDYSSTYVLEEGHIDGYTAKIEGSQTDGFTVTNTRNIETVTVTKTLNDVSKDADAVDFAFTVTLKNSEGDAIADYVLYSDAENPANSIVTDDDGQATFTLSVKHAETASQAFTIPFGASLAVTETENQNYDTAIVVTSTIDGDQSHTNTVANITGVTTNDLSISGTTTVAFTNTVKAQRVSVWKTDLSYNALTGASFALYSAEDYDDVAGAPVSGTEPLATGTVDANGILSLGMLADGSYRLVETQAPAGYNAADSAIEITITAGRVAALQSGNDSDVYKSGDTYWVAGQDESTWQVRVWNNPGVELPAAGGSGTVVHYVLGALIVIVGVALAWNARKRSVDEG